MNQMNTDSHREFGWHNEAKRKKENTWPTQCVERERGRGKFNSFAFIVLCVFGWIFLLFAPLLPLL